MSGTMKFMIPMTLLLLWNPLCNCVVGYKPESRFKMWTAVP